MLCRKQLFSAEVRREGVLHFRGRATRCLSVCLVSQLVNRQLVKDVLAQPRGAARLYLHPAPLKICLLQPCPGRRGEPRTDGHSLGEILHPSPEPMPLGCSPEKSRAARAGWAARPLPSPGGTAAATAALGG